MNLKEQQSQGAYNKLAKNYDNTFDGRFTRPFKDELVSQVILKDGDAVLDVACGTGELLARLNDKCNIRGAGIDISDEMIKVAKSKYDKFDFLVSSCAPLPFKENTFDVLTVSAAFHHFPEPKKFASEALRVLKRGGKLYIAEVYFPIPIRQIMNLLVLPLYNSGDVKIYHSKELTEMFTRAGFLNVSVIKKGKIQLLYADKGI
ncbi:MAG TPA: methyltransferase domain-containing protein [Bacillota bacterium]|nr:methyltransferase domain-containing protein [Bacillota bacterium]